MLAEFRVSNYRSFKDEQVLSMIATSEESKGKNSVKIGKYNILKSAVVYGANASGKSNLIKAMACMNDIVSNSAGYKPDQPLLVVPFAFDEETPKQPSTFEVTFFMDGTRYQYGFAATKEIITGEWLKAWPAETSRPRVLFERDAQEPEPYFGPSLKGQNKAIWEKVKDNSLFLSTAAQWNHEQLSNVYKWFTGEFRKMPPREFGTLFTDQMFFSANNPIADSVIPELAMRIFKKADLGIDNINIEIADSKDLHHSQNAIGKYKNTILENLPFLPAYKTTFSHCSGKYSLPFEDESDGTQNFYSFLWPLVHAVMIGFTLFEDELELNMHPLLTRTMIEFFHDYKNGNKQAQLIFTTHDTTLLDPELFGRDQVWFTEKDNDGATQLYSLAEYKDVRRDEPMQKRYLAGRYGAIPVLERFDLGGTKK